MQQQISGIVERHNILHVFEGTANMELMVWSTSLAATCPAQCQFRHLSKTVHPEFRGIGQNMFATDGNRINVTQVIHHWYIENAHYTYDSMKCVPGKQCGHESHDTQVISANSGNVGCAGHHRAFMYVGCNYRPAGNYRDVISYTRDQRARSVAK